MKNYILLAIIGSLAMAALPAQAIITFEKYYGSGDADICEDVKQTPDGGYILAGYYIYNGKKVVGTDTTDESSKLEYRTPLLIKTDSLGNLQWASWNNFTWRMYCSYETVELMPGGGYLCGSLLDGVASLVRLNSSGDTLWSRKIDTLSGGNSGMFDMTKVNDNYYTMVAGRRRAVSILCVDSLGDTLWTKAHGDTLIEVYVSYSISQTMDHGYAITGYHLFIGDTTKGYDLFIMKVDSLGNKEWEKIYGGTGEERGYCVKQSPDGGYIIGGFNDSFGDSGDIWVIKTDSLGDTLWTRVLGGTGNDWCYSLLLTSDSCFVIAGTVRQIDNNQLYLMKLNNNGDSLWARLYGGSLVEVGYCVRQNADLSFIVGGTTRSWGSGNADYYLVKTDTAGCLGVEGYPGDKLLTKPGNLKIYPNPLRGRANIKYALDKEAQVTMAVYNINGQKIEEIINNRQTPGEYNYSWGANKYSNGIYFIRLSIDGRNETEKAIIIK